jgi:hypothetical protein
VSFKLHTSYPPPQLLVIMSNPTISKSTYLSLNIDPTAYPQSYLTSLGVCDSVWQSSMKSKYDVEAAVKYVKGLGLNVTLREGVNIPAALNYDPLVRNRKNIDGDSVPVEDMLASTSKQGAVWRKTDLPVGSVIASAIYKFLPDVGTTFSKSVIYDTASQLVGVSGGPVLTMGRLKKYLPVHGYQPPEPIRQEEVDRGFQGMGLDILTHKFGAAKSLFRIASNRKDEPGDRERYVRLNAKAGTGFPTQCKIDVPAAKDIIFSLVDLIKSMDSEEEDEDKYRRIAIYNGLRTLDHKYPYLFLSQGKMKADMYKASKVQNQECRFYAVVPAAPKLVIMQAMQALERDKRTIHSNTWEDYIANTFCATFSGMNLGPSSVKSLVDCVEFQMAQRAMGFLHMGDDTDVCVRFFEGTIYEFLARFALDASAFDLTQNHGVNKPVDARLVAMLEKYDMPAGQLYKYMTDNKRVVLLGSLVAEMKDASLSGFPGVSIKNGVLMHILMERLRERLDEVDKEMRQQNSFSPAKVEQEVAIAVEQVGKSLGFTIKLEQYVHFMGRLTFTDTLELKPDKFVGYYLYAETLGGKRAVRAVWDTERALAQLKHPQFRWYKEALVSQAVNTVRVASTLMAVCDPLPDMAYAIKKGQGMALERLEALIVSVSKGEVEDPYVTGGAMDDELAVLADGELGLEATNYEKSLSGLAKALRAVIEKNDLLTTCRRLDVPFVRSSKDISIAETVGDDVVATPRTRKYIKIGALASNRPAPSEKHIGRQPPTTIRHPPRIHFGTKAPKERNQRYEEDDDESDYGSDNDSVSTSYTERTADFEERQYQKDLDQRDDDIQLMTEQDSVQQSWDIFVG